MCRGMADIRSTAAEIRREKKEDRRNKTQNPLKFVGVPQTRQQISAVSRPKLTILSGHVEEVLLLNKFFFDCRYVPSLRRYGPTKLCDGAEMAIFGDFFASCIFSEPRAAHFRRAF